RRGRPRGRFPQSFQVSLLAIPEPTSGLLLGIGLAVVVRARNERTSTVPVASMVVRLATTTHAAHGRSRCSPVEKRPSATRSKRPESQGFGRFVFASSTVLAQLGAALRLSADGWLVSMRPQVFR